MSSVRFVRRLPGAIARLQGLAGPAAGEEEAAPEAEPDAEPAIGGFREAAGSQAADQKVPCMAWRR